MGMGIEFGSVIIQILALFGVLTFVLVAGGGIWLIFKLIRKR